MSLTDHKHPCISSKCGSSNALSYAEDNSAFCFSCNTYFSPKQVEDARTGTESPSKKTSITIEGVSNLPSLDVPERGLRASTLEHYGVGVEVSTTNREPETLIFPVRKEGRAVGRKKKTLATKNIWTEGDCENSDLFGEHLIGTGGRLLIITEGEEDAMSAHQMLQEQGKNYKVVSLPFGANTKAIRNRLQVLEQFENVVLNFDNDKVGRECASEVAKILSPGKAKIMQLPVKDANDLLLSERNNSIYLKAINEAQPYKPDGVVSLADAWDSMWDDDSTGSIRFPWNGLNNKLYALRGREIVTVTAGTGVGKSAVMRELEHHLIKNTDDNLGVLALEESVGRTAWGILSVEANLPLSIREERLKLGINKDTPEIKEMFNNTMGNGRVFSFDHFGSTSEDNLLFQVRYMIKGLQCKWIILDHLSIVVSAMNDMGDERKTIDSIMTKLRQLVEETGAGMLLVCHLRRIDGNRGHEQGVEVSLSHLRGSQSIAQLSDAVISLERNQQADNIKEANLTVARVLKNRYAGLTGIATHLAYNPATGRMSEVEDKETYLLPDDINF